MVPDARKITEEILGYLNFSDGTSDPGFIKNLGELFEQIKADDAWRELGNLLHAELQQLRDTSKTFSRAEQVEAVLALVFDHLLPAYRRWHGDLLFHQTDKQLFRPFFIARACEAVLQQGEPWDQTERIVSGTMERLNNYIGYRPVAVLETERKIQPYAHEWVCPIPLFIRSAGIAVGPYRELIEKALEILEATDPDLLLDAMFDPALLDELALDPRAYDFDHPANKRPNNLFGQWDMHNLDNSGRCRRFVVQQAALEAMLDRVESRGKLPREEVLFEAAAVLAGTMLMGSGTGGNRPDAHDSDVTLSVLVQHIAAYRDAFYERLIAAMHGPHAERLREEAARLHQPFGGARQHFNHHLARQRAEQLQCVHLAQLFARMGYTDAAARQIGKVPVASARMLCDIYCRLTAAYRSIEDGRLEAAAKTAEEIEDILHRGIECGAIADPWNILGFDGNYSLFPALEDSIHDHRIDGLINLVGAIFGLYVRIEKSAGAAGNTELQEAISTRMGKLADWWDQYASIEVGSVEGISGRETRESADHVADALRAWRQAGAAAGDIAFWRGHVEQFQSPKAYALVVEALLEQHDPVAAMALLVQWLSRSEHIPLVEEDYAFHDLALYWMEDLWKVGDEPAEPGMDVDQCWKLSRKFFDYLEANAEENWEAPSFELADEQVDDTEQEDDDSDDLFSAAYENVTYRDSTDDGFEGELFDGGGMETDFELAMEGDRIITRLSFLTMLAKLWRLAAAASATDQLDCVNRDDVLSGWLDRAMTNRRNLLELLTAVHRYRIPAPRGAHEALLDYDRRLGIKVMLLEQIIDVCVETTDAATMIHASMRREEPIEGMDDWELPAGRVLSAVMRCDAAAVHKTWRRLIDALSDQPLLYVSLIHGGSPRRIVASRSLQCVLRRLFAYLPRLGLLGETARLLKTAQNMEIAHPVGHGAITEFDQMFQIACKAIVRCLVVSSEGWHDDGQDETDQQCNVNPIEDATEYLIEYLEQVVESLLRCWLDHSRGVRLSVLETISDRKHWNELKRFIERYGGELFTQRFMNLGNLRAILHQGVDAWLHSLEKEPGAEDELLLLRELDGRLPREDAVRRLSLILEAVAESYTEYIDYNSTTTQSDRGEMLYTLLDFLRLKVRYDRVDWNMQPVVLAHEVLVRCGRHEAAEVWREAVAQRTAGFAKKYLEQFSRMAGKYGMKLPSVADRLGERFVRPMEIDRLLALVSPAVEQLHNGEQPEAFARLEAEIARFTGEPTGTGFEVPAWLDALEQEADHVQLQAADDDDDDLFDPYLRVPQVRLSAAEAALQVDEIKVISG